MAEQEASAGAPEAPKPKSRKTKRRRAARKTQASGSGGGGRRASAAFPLVPFSTVLILAEAIQTHAAGQPMRRLTLFEKLSKSPESSASRLLLINSSRYGLTVGGYAAETISLTELGKKATSPEEPPASKMMARFKLAVESIVPFKFLYERNKGNRLPSPEVLRDSLGELTDVAVPEEERKQCVDVFLENLTFLGMLKTIAGAQRILSIEHSLEEMGSGVGMVTAFDSTPAKALPEAQKRTEKEWKKICFVIAPIGSDGSEERKHSDMVLESLITRALEADKYEIIRADQIAMPGMISGQVIEHLLKSALVIADLSFHNPNVFYELATRHLVGTPTVHLIRKGDAIPFDLKDFRTITIDTSDKYDLVAKLDTYRAEIANHVRQAMQGGESSDNPLRVFAKGLTIKL